MFSTLPLELLQKIGNEVHWNLKLNSLLLTEQLNLRLFELETGKACDALVLCSDRRSSLMF